MGEVGLDYKAKVKKAVQWEVFARVLDLAVEFEREEKLYEKHNMLMVTLPGDEEKYGGCLASGRGFLHISSTGALEACPFAPYSDTNIKEMPLKEALKSGLLKEIRDKHDTLKESRGGCALKENREWVESLLAQADNI